MHARGKKWIRTKTPKPRRICITISDMGSKVEDECPLKGKSVVLSDSSGFFTATLQAASRLERNSKFYVLQLIQESQGEAYHIWARWGRIGGGGVSKLTPYDSIESAKAAFISTFKNKTGNEWKSRFTGFVPKEGKYSLMGHEKADETQERAKQYDEMMSRFRAHPNEGRVEEIQQEDESKGEIVESVRTHRWQYYVDDHVDGKATGWYDYDLEASDVVDFAFKDWKRNPAVSVRAIKSGTYTYSVNFNEMEQTNIEHHNHKKRVLRREIHHGNDEISPSLAESANAAITKAVKRHPPPLTESAGAAISKPPKRRATKPKKKTVKRATNAFKDSTKIVKKTGSKVRKPRPSKDIVFKVRRNASRQARAAQERRRIGWNAVAGMAFELPAWFFAVPAGARKSKRLASARSSLLLGRGLNKMISIPERYLTTERLAGIRANRRIARSKSFRK
eukprot:jgi/Bigna1/75209/fgenesh1_pg.33_\